MSRFSKGTFKKNIDKKQNREIKKLKNKVSKLEKTADDKFIDLQMAPTNVNSTWTQLQFISGAVAFNQLAQGTTNVTRVGNSITMHNLQINYMVSIPDSISADSVNIVRVFVVCIKRADFSGGAPGVNAFLQDSTATSPLHLLTPYKKDPNVQYKILYDRTHTLSGDSGNPRIIVKKFHINWKQGLKSEYERDNFTSPTSNYIYAFAASDSGLAGHPVLSMYCRLNYSG